MLKDCEPLGWQKQESRAKPSLVTLAEIEKLFVRFSLSGSERAMSSTGIVGEFADRQRQGQIDDSFVLFGLTEVYRARYCASCGARRTIMVIF